MYYSYALTRPAIAFPDEELLHLVLAQKSYDMGTEHGFYYVGCSTIGVARGHENALYVIPFTFYHAVLRGPCPLPAELWTITWLDLVSMFNKNDVIDTRNSLSFVDKTVNRWSRC